MWMPDNKRPNERDQLTWKEHLFLATICLIVFLVIVWIFQ